MGPQPSEARATELLHRLRSGDGKASGELLSLVYDELHTQARRLMAAERGAHTLQTTALVNEAWMRLAPASSEWEDRAHFLRVAARAMRNVLIDHARKKRSAKRGEGRAAVPLDEALAVFERDQTDLLALDEALRRLATEDEQAARIVELRYFGGLTLEETGKVLGLTSRQVDWNWSVARGWLRRELERGAAADD